MPEHLKALIVVLGLAVPVLILAKQPLVSAGYDELTFRRHRAMWLVVTLLAFLSHSFWLSSALCAAALYVTAAKDRAPLALYFTVLFAYPHFSMLIPGIGPIEHLFQANHPRTLNFVILAPIAARLYRDRATRPPISRVSDLAILGLLVVMFVAHAPHASTVGNTRIAFYLFIDIWIPYYVASRAIRSVDDFRRIAGGFLIAAVILALLAVFESTRHWLLYESLRSALGVPPQAMYLYRGDGGPLRANVSQVHSIVLGYALMVGLGMYALLWKRLQPQWKSIVACLCLLAGLGASLSRGPWVGAAGMMFALILLGPNRAKRMTTALATGGAILIILMITPFGQRAIDYLPFIGTVEPGSVEYRTRLWQASMETFAQNPVLGDTRFLDNPIMEQMRQGAGLIDIVNSYLQIALAYGAVGLVLFLAALLLPIRAVWRARQAVLRSDPEMEWLGRVLLAVMAGTLVTIATASSIGTIPTIYWFLAGLCMSYERLVRVVLLKNSAPTRRIHRASPRTAAPTGIRPRLPPRNSRQ